MKLKRTLSIIIALGLSTFIIWEIKDIIKSKREPKQWTSEQKRIMKNDLIKSSKTLSTMDSATANKITECVIEKVISTYTYDEIWELNDLSKQDKEKVIAKVQSLIQQCMESSN